MGESAFRGRAFATGHKLLEKISTDPNYAFSPDDLRAWAEAAFKDRSYLVALHVFDKLATSNDPYKYNDVARLKHGTAMWQVAERDDYGANIPDRLQMLKSAIDLLDRAADHMDPMYSARALYQQSKALWHLWRYGKEMSILEQARECANRAAKVAYDPAFVSWYDRVERDYQREKEGA